MAAARRTTQRKAKTRRTAARRTTRRTTQRKATTRRTAARKTTKRM